MERHLAVPLSIGILGGSFDPVHLGHLNLAMEMVEKRRLDEVWWCPAQLNPHKAGRAPVLPPLHRLSMLRLALAKFSKFKIIELELARSGPSYTIDTVEQLLIDLQPGSQLFLIIGEDALIGLPRWHRIDELIQKAPLLVGRRVEEEQLAAITSSQALRRAIELGMTKTRFMEISSTEVRSRLRQGLNCRHLLPEKVMDYIEIHDLYSSLSDEV